MSTTNLNIPPYYDDYAPESDFHQILFRPGFPVQARELTQLQSILQEQVRRFGNHVFKHGSVVVPGNSFAELAVPVVRVLSSYNSLAVDYSVFENQTVVGASSGVVAIVKMALPATDTDPISFYLAYISGGDELGVPNGLLEFTPGEEIYIQSVPSTRVTLSNTPQAYGSIACVNRGVYYVNGTFVSVEAQSIVISRYTSTPSAKVLLKITEEIVDSGSDQTLLDPAQGSYNYAAPGADRLKISLTLTTLSLDTSINDDYIELMRYNEGVLEEHSRYPKYSELEKSLARRTFDESGDYIVEGLRAQIREHKRTNTNSGVYQDGDIAKLVYNVGPGKAYVSGYEVETIATSKLAVDKCRTTDHVKIETAKFKVTYGQYILVTGIKGKLVFNSDYKLNLFGNSGNAIGTAYPIAIDYHTGDGTASPIYKLYISNISFISNQDSLNKVFRYDLVASTAAITVTNAAITGKVVSEYILPTTGRVIAADSYILFYDTPINIARKAKIAFWNSAENKTYAYNEAAFGPNAGDVVTITTNSTGLASTGWQTTVNAKNTLLTDGQSGVIFQLPKNSIKTLKNASDNYDLEYVSNVILDIGSGTTISGIVPGVIAPIEAGTFIAVNANGPVPNGLFSINSNGNQIVISAGTSATYGAITIYCQVQNSALTLRTKTETTATVTMPASKSLTLTHYDVYKIISIIKADGVDVTNSYSLDANVSEYSYNKSKLILNSNAILPSGNIAITYKHYTHSEGGYFSIDSYPHSGEIEKIPTYTSTTGVLYNLRDCLDFRTSGLSTAIIVSGTMIETTVQRYMPRYDSICIDKSSKLSVISGQPEDNPTPPSIPKELYEIQRVFLPAYTNKLADIRVQQVGTTRYTMKDVSDIEQRISRLEDFTTLTAVESKTVRINVLDAKTGLDRFKTGYLVEDFSDPFVITNMATEDLKVSMTPKDGMFAKTEEMQLFLSLLNETIETHRSGKIMLPYTEVAVIECKTSSRVTNVNPFLVFKWVGVMTLMPPSSTWTETKSTTVINDIIYRNSSVTIDRIVWVDPEPVPAPAPAPEAAIPREAVGPGGATEQPVAWRWQWGGWDNNESTAFSQRPAISQVVVSPQW